jgi:hypothetical protein
MRSGVFRGIIVAGMIVLAVSPSALGFDGGRNASVGSRVGSGPTADSSPVTHSEPPAASSLIAGVATWCAPTPTHCQSWGGGAMVGAVPGFDGDPYTVRVCLDVQLSTFSCVVVRVVSSCACGDRGGRGTVIDLSPAAFRKLAPLSRGVIPVTVERADILLPATDMIPEGDRVWPVLMAAFVIGLLLFPVRRRKG